MKLTDALIGEHGAFYTLFDEIEEIATRERAMALILGSIAVLEAMVVSHASLEEQLLFSALEPHLGKDQGPLAVMCAEHTEMKALLEEIEDAEDVGHASHLVKEALTAARSHFGKEEQVLFPMAENLLGDEVLTELGKIWADTRGVTIR